MFKHIKVPRKCTECPFLDYVDSTYGTHGGMEYRSHTFHCGLSGLQDTCDRCDVRCHNCPLCVPYENIVEVYDWSGKRWDIPPETCATCPFSEGLGDGAVLGRCGRTKLVTAYRDFRPRRCPLTWEEEE